MATNGVSIAKIIDLLDLKNFTDEIEVKKRKITTTDVNRPALQLTGYFEHFQQSRVQIIGNVEYTFLQKLSDEERRTHITEFMKFDIFSVALLISPKVALLVKMQKSSNREVIAVFAIILFPLQFLSQMPR